MKRASFFLFDSFTAGILFLLFTTLLFVMIPTYSNSLDSQPQLVSFLQTIKHTEALSEFITSGIDTNIVSYMDSALPNNLCVNISYYDSSSVFVDSAIKTNCDGLLSTHTSIVYGSTYVGDFYIVKVEGWYE